MIGFLRGFFLKKMADWLNSGFVVSCLVLVLIVSPSHLIIQYGSAPEMCNIIRIYIKFEDRTDKSVPKAVWHHEALPSGTKQ